MRCSAGEVLPNVMDTDTIATSPSENIGCVCKKGIQAYLQREVIKDRQVRARGVRKPDPLQAERALHAALAIGLPSLVLGVHSGLAVDHCKQTRARGTAR